MQDQRVRALVGFVWGLLLFLGLAYSLHFVLPSDVIESPVRAQLALKGTMIVLALLGWAMQGRPFAGMGWQRPVWKPSHLIWFGVGAIAMMAATVVMIFLGVKHPLVAQMSFPEIILIIWIGSSVSEEIYVRGLVQSWIIKGQETTGLSPFSPSIVSSALLFAGMHVSLIRTMGTEGGVSLVLATLGLGWACAVLRARSRSLWLAIACHVLGNIAAVPGGILAALLHVLIFGRLPEMMKPG